MPNYMLMAIFVVASFLVYSSVSVALPINVSPVRWQSCMNSEFQPWFQNDLPDSELLCGYLDVPLQYQTGTSITHPKNRQVVRLALTLLPATGTRKGSLVTISGGPGYSGINPYFSTDGPVSRLRESWDIVGFDPRGVGQSTPRIACPPLTEAPPKDENHAAAIEEWTRHKVTACIKHTGATVLQHIGTDEAVSDLDRIRQSLGEAKLTALAWSYGTQVAAMYAERFPSQTRALVLDGVVDLSQDHYTANLTQARGFQQSFERFTTWCVKNGDCPLPADHQQALIYFRTLLSRLEEKPLLTANQEKITAAELISLTILSLLWPSEWPRLATAVGQLDAGIVSDEVVRALKESQAGLEYDALSVINCADSAQPEMDLQILRRQRQDIGQAMAFADYLPYQYALDSVCDFWPWRGKVRAHRPVPAKQLPKLLFVAQRYDPTTPWPNARAMANAFNSPLVTLERDGHTLALFGHNLCVDNRVVDYLMAPDKPHFDKTCF